MTKQILDHPLIREFIDSLPPDNNWVTLARVAAKSLLFRRRPYRGFRAVFPGVEDVILEPEYWLGPGPEEVLAVTEFSAVSPGTEKGYYLDQPNFQQPRPYVPGYSGCGRVRAAGRSAAGFRRGDRVAGVFKHSSLNICLPGSLAPVPDSVSSRDAALVTLGVIARAGVRAAGISPGVSVGVLGQGILGQMADQMAWVAGAGRVTALALGDSKRKLAEKSGADEFIALQSATRPLSSLNFDVVIDVTGSLKGFESALEMVRPGGRVVMLGSIPKYAEKSDWARVAVEKGVEVRGAHVRNLDEEGLSYRDEADCFLKLLAEKKVELGHLVTDTLKPESAPGIYRRLAAGDRGMVGVVIDWQSS